jgi:hypothetical protein
MTNAKVTLYIRLPQGLKNARADGNRAQASSSPIELGDVGKHHFLSYSGGTPAKWRSITSRERSQVESVWGKEASCHLGDRAIRRLPNSQEG